MIEAVLAIDLQLRQLCAISVDLSQSYACYPIAIGKQSTPTPTGNFEVSRLVSDPQYVSCQTGVNHGTGFLGDYAIVTNLDTVLPNCKFAIHGTNSPHEVLNRKAITGGCNRMLNEDISEIVNNYRFTKGIVR